MKIFFRHEGQSITIHVEADSSLFQLRQVLASILEKTSKTPWTAQDVLFLSEGGTPLAGEGDPILSLSSVTVDSIFQNDATYQVSARRRNVNQFVTLNRPWAKRKVSKTDIQRNDLIGMFRSSSISEPEESFPQLKARMHRVLDVVIERKMMKMNVVERQQRSEGLILDELEPSWKNTPKMDWVRTSHDTSNQINTQVKIKSHRVEELRFIQHKPRRKSMSRNNLSANMIGSRRRSRSMDVRNSYELKKRASRDVKKEEYQPKEEAVNDDETSEEYISVTITELDDEEMEEKKTEEIEEETAQDDTDAKTQGAREVTKITETEENLASKGREEKQEEEDSDRKRREQVEDIVQSDSAIHDLQMSVPDYDSDEMEEMIEQANMLKFTSEWEESDRNRTDSVSSYASPSGKGSARMRWREGSFSRSPKNNRTFKGRAGQRDKGRSDLFDAKEVNFVQTDPVNRFALSPPRSNSPSPSTPPRAKVNHLKTERVDSHPLSPGDHDEPPLSPRDHLFHSRPAPRRQNIVNQDGKTIRKIHEIRTLDEAAKQLRRLRYAAIVNELISTEKDYLSDLDILRNLYFQPMADEQMISDVQMNEIFGNILTIQQINQFIYEELLKRREEPNGVGYTFLRYSAFLKMYLEYCANQTIQLARVNELDQKNRNFHNLLVSAKKRPECRQLPFDSYLSRPVQRICKYPLLLRELIESSYEVEQMRQLKTAMVQITDCITQINSRMQFNESIKRLIEINRDIESVPTHIHLLVPGRRLVKEGPVGRIVEGKLRERYLFLYNDILIFTKVSRLIKVSYVYRGHIKIGEAFLTDVPSGGNSNGDFRFGILGREESAAVLITCQNVETKYEWMKALQESVCRDIHGGQRVSIYNSQDVAIFLAAVQKQAPQEFINEFTKPRPDKEESTGVWRMVPSVAKYSVKAMSLPNMKEERMLP
ncbi:calmodulin-binding protein [Planoprotostelium fungivorum]|uniref:Calmodulin-binding protein n=1 Tax=Planoprotostelium fungivorum TaxID=1890364 RepID=A0A2P6NEH3_9EUKA|nr:calmodulin-binding protein [Planoprotostelium fungivorum]